MPYAKALLACLIALVGGIAVGYTDDSLTKGEFWAAAAAGLVALGGVFQIPNTKSTDRGEDGAVDFGGIIGLLVVVILVLVIIGMVR